MPGCKLAVPARRFFVGYGVRTAIQGHDLHGLTFGPDDRLWWVARSGAISPRSRPAQPNRAVTACAFTSSRG